VNVHWTKDLKAESDLERTAVSYSVQDIALSKIDFDESQINGARIESPLLRHLIDDYKQGFENGDAFPMPVVANAKRRGMYVVLSGNQRTTALRELQEAGKLAKSMTLPCYLVDTKDKLLQEIIARSANVAHGGRSDKAERLQHAVYCVQGLGLTTAQAARMFMVSETNITHHIRAEKQRNALFEAGVNAAPLSLAVLDELRKVPDKSTRVKLGQLAAKHSPSSERVRQVVTTMKREDAAAGRLNRVKEFERELVTQVHATSTPKNGKAPKVPKRPRRDKMLRLLDQMCSFLEAGPTGHPFTSLSEMQFTGGEDTKRARHLWDDVSRKMKIIMSKEK
jgi:nucleoside 2-deoxyribosyltransferase